MSEHAVRLLAAALGVCAAAMVKGAIGFGFPLLAVPLLSSILGPKVAIPVVAIPTLFSNFLVIRRGGAGEAAGTMWGLLAATAAGAVVGAMLLGAVNPRLAAALVGTVAILYVVTTAMRLTVRIPAASVRRAGPAFGLAAGLMGGATGISSPLLASYLHMLRLGKREFVFWITMTFVVVNIAQIAMYSRLGLYAGPVLGLAFSACVPMAAGTLAGLALQDRLEAQLFERIVLAVVAAASADLIVRSL